MSKKKSKRIDVRVPEDTYYALKYLCEIDGISITKFIERSIVIPLKKRVLNNSEEFKKWLDFKEKFENQQK